MTRLLVLLVVLWSLPAQADSEAPAPAPELDLRIAGGPSVAFDSELGAPRGGFAVDVETVLVVRGSSGPPPRPTSTTVCRASCRPATTTHWCSVAMTHCPTSWRRARTDGMMKFHLFRIDIWLLDPELDFSDCPAMYSPKLKVLPSSWVRWSPRPN